MPTLTLAEACQMARDSLLRAESERREYADREAAGASWWEETMIDHSLLYPDFNVRLGTLLTLLQQRGLSMHGVAGFRTHAQQHAIYEQGRGRPGPIVTSADAGHSPHEYGCGADMVFSGGHPYVGDWQAYGECVKRAGLTWGGAWGDFCHCEYPKWRDVRAQGWAPK
jgi:hypothetical protein